MYFSLCLHTWLRLTEWLGLIRQPPLARTLDALLQQHVVGRGGPRKHSAVSIGTTTLLPTF